MLTMLAHRLLLLPLLLLLPPQLPLLTGKTTKWMPTKQRQCSRPSGEFVSTESKALTQLLPSLPLFLLLPPLLLLLLLAAKMDTFYDETVFQTRWEMSDLNSSSFPQNASGQPNLAYYFPLGALITQV
jgi:hypothetical protein